MIETELPIGLVQLRLIKHIKLQHKTLEAQQFFCE